MRNTAEYRIYQNMLKEYPKVNLDKDCSADENKTFAFLTVSLAKLNARNPLTPNDPGYNEYEDMIYFFDKWPKDKQNCAFKKRFLYAAQKLCELQPTNIFGNSYKRIEIVSLDEMKEAEYAATELEDAMTGTYIPAGDSLRVFGVVETEDEKEDTDDLQ